VDYAQAFDAEADEKSVERVVARLAWRLNDLAKRTGASVVLMSQVKREVLDRGRRWFDSWRWKNPNEPLRSEAVEGFRPLAGDLQWSTALWQRCKQGLFLFRPGSWLRSMGADTPDDVMEVSIAKGNFGPNNEIIRLGWDGPRARIFDARAERK
jgi:replicative DNA helicase